jgi:hypothetical protein
MTDTKTPKIKTLPKGRTSASSFVSVIRCKYNLVSQVFQMWNTLWPSLVKIDEQLEKLEVC